MAGITHATSGTTLENIQYVLNAVGNRTRMTDSAGTTTWGYDARDRLTSASYPNGDAVAYGYDAVGNRTTQTVNGVTKTNTFDQANRMTASGADTYTYDATGNQTSRTSGGVTTTYAYDKLDRLTAISGGGVSASYTYNGDGLRVAKTVAGVTTRYAWDPTGLGVVLADGAEYVWGAGLISQSTASGTPTYTHADGLGSIRLLTDATGAVVGSQQYDAFGASRAQSGTQLPFGYTGEQTDPESGLVYLRARYLDPATGRFLTRDPLPGYREVPASLHPYLYAQNHPVNWTDPTGKDCESGQLIDTAACAGMAGGIALGVTGITILGLPVEVVIIGGAALVVAGGVIVGRWDDIKDSLVGAKEKVEELLGQFFASREKRWIKEKARQLGIPERTLGNAIHRLKGREVRGDDDVEIDDDGNVTCKGEPLGNIFDDPEVQRALRDNPRRR